MIVGVSPPRDNVATVDWRGRLVASGRAKDGGQKLTVAATHSSTADEGAPAVEDPPVIKDYEVVSEANSGPMVLTPSNSPSVRPGRSWVQNCTSGRRRGAARGRAAADRGM